MLYTVSIAHGVSSVELGLDRGVSRQMVIRFERAGQRIHVVQQNLDYRASFGEEALAQNVDRSFAISMLASLPIEAEEGARILVAATSLLMRDATDIRGRLRDRAQGNFRLDRERSALYMPRTKSFPQNSEVEVTLTFAGDEPGELVRSVTPDGRSLTLRIHHSTPPPPLDDCRKAR